MIKIKFVFLGFFFFNTCLSFAQIPNGDFENWAIGHLSRMEPTGWLTSDSLYTSATVIQDAGHNSTTSAEFTCVFDASSGHYKGGKIDLVHQHYTGVGQPATIGGFWKFNNPSHQDDFGLEIWMYDASNAQIGHCTVAPSFGSSVLTWTAFSASINYTNANPVANYSIQISVFNLSSNPATTANLDDLGFDIGTGLYSSAPGISESYTLQRKSNGTNQFLLDCNKTKNGPLSVTVYDINGKLLGENQFQRITSGAPMTIDLNAHSQGIYFITVLDAEERQSFRIVVL